MKEDNVSRLRFVKSCVYEASGIDDDDDDDDDDVDDDEEEDCS